MRLLALRVFTVVVLTAGPATTLMAQQPEPTTRVGEREKAQAEKVPTLHPYVTGTGERLIAKVETTLAGTAVRWHPFFQNAGPGGGFPFGVGYAKYVSPYSMIDVRGSYTIKDYKRVEAEFTAPRLFQRRGELSLLGGWREATQVGFFGLGTDSALDDRTNYLFRQPYASGLLTFRPTRRFLTLSGGAEWTQWTQRSGEGSHPSVETKYTAETLPGLGAEIIYLHTQATIGFDWRTAEGYSRRGGFYGITVHDYDDREDAFGHDRIDYEAVQHFPILREAWVLSLHGHVSAASNKDGQQIPFFMTPSLGGGHNLRGYDSFRFRDRNSLLLQGEWRIMVNRFVDFAFFYDAGKVTPHRTELDFSNLKSDYGLGARFHGLFSTPFRVELARSNERLAVIFATSAAF